MTQTIQSIKKIGLFLLGVVTIVLGFKANVANAQTKPETAEMKTPEIAEKMSTNEASGMASNTDKAANKKPETKLEKAKPERAHASKGRWKKKGSADRKHEMAEKEKKALDVDEAASNKAESAPEKTKP